MKNIDVVFENNPNLNNIIVTVSASQKDDQIDFLMDLIRNSGGNDLFVTDDKNNIRRITEDRIIRIQVDNKNLSISTDDGEFKLKRTLQEMEYLLNSSMFLKISRFEIINLQKVKKFDFTITGTLRIEFEDGCFTWASRRFIPIIKQRLSERNGER
ncbi:MAG: LytTR family transcriptional regulator [Flexilinea sp.]|nr:LytTR family transcriptional regulator [Flexilinea sp.]